MNTGKAVKTVVPISGKILVDGEPHRGVVLTLNTSGGERIAGQAEIYTGEKGDFVFTTYKSGDGLEPGEYKLTFEWLKVRKGGALLEPPDMLNGRYSDPAASNFTLKVVEGTPQNDLKYELTTK